MKKLLLGIIAMFALQFVKAQNVGIGTTDPKDILHLYKNDDIRGFVETSTSGYCGWRFKNSLHEYFAGINSGSNEYIIYDNTTNKMRIIVTAIGNVGINTIAPAASAQLDVSSTTKGFLPPRMDSAQRNAIDSPEEGLIVYNTTIKAFQVYNGTTWYSTVHYIGESYGGGIVFYVYDNGQHGLIAATTDQSAAIRWHNGTYRYTGSTGDGLNAGAMNTALIIATQIADVQTGNFAAKVCADYSVTVDGITYGDWYLPSINELNILFLQKAVVGGFSGLNYWSSTESDNNFAKYQNFANGGGQGNTFKVSLNLVRAVRAF